MMLTMQEFMELVDYKITEGGDYTYATFGPYAYQLTYWNEKHEDGGHSFSIVFDTKTQEVYSVEAQDYTNNRSYRMIDQEHQTEDNKAAYDEVYFVDLDDVNDFLEKAYAIKRGEPYVSAHDHGGFVAVGDYLELRAALAERDALRADAERYLEKLIECRSSVKIAANEFDRFMIRKQPDANQCDIDEQKRLYDLLDWIDTAMKGKS